MPRPEPILATLDAVFFLLLFLSTRRTEMTVVIAIEERRVDFLGLEFYLHSLERCSDQHEMSSVHEAGFLE